MAISTYVKNETHSPQDIGFWSLCDSRARDLREGIFNYVYSSHTRTHVCWWFLRYVFVSGSLVFANKCPHSIHQACDFTITSLFTLTVLFVFFWTGSYPDMALILLNKTYQIIILVLNNIYISSICCIWSYWLTITALHRKDSKHI